MSEIIRRCIFRPYRKGMGPSFRLTVRDTGRTIGGKHRLGYLLTRIEPGTILNVFEGDDFGCSPLHAVDSDETVAAIMGFLTLRPGDTDAEYFENYTADQLEFCQQHAESLSCEVLNRFGEC